MVSPRPTGCSNTTATGQGALRHWEATTRLADNQARVKACADRADRFSDYRRLAPCEIHVSSRRRAIEVGQGIVD
jgi:hypothetical protein